MEVQLNNSRLEELLKKLVSCTISAAEQSEFIETVKKSQFIIPLNEMIENGKDGELFKPEGDEFFDFNLVVYDDGDKGVALFTSEEMITDEFKGPSIVMDFRDILEIFKKDDERYGYAEINPNDDYPLEGSLEVFDALFGDFEFMDELLEGIRNHYEELEADVAFIHRCEDNFMINDSIDSKFVSPIPLNISSDPEFNKGMEYINVLLLPEKTKVLRIAEEGLDILLAPGTEFELIEQPDKVTSIWKCVAQPFYD